MELMGCHLLTDEVGVMLEESAVVAHTLWVARALDRCYENGRAFALLTPASSRLTLGLSRFLETTGGRWFVSDGTGHYDGFTGESHEWDGANFRPTQQFGRGYLDLPEAGQSGVLFIAEAVHPARSSTQIGRVVETLCHQCTGDNPIGWGVLEPVSEPWNLAELTSQVRDESMPKAALVHAVGRRGEDAFTATMTVERTQSGVVERVHAQWPLAEPWGTHERLWFHDAMHEAGVRFASAYAVQRTQGLFRAPSMQSDGVPMSALLGPEVLRGRGVEATLQRLGVAARAVDRGRWQSVGVSYPSVVPGVPIAEAEHPSAMHRALVDWLADN